MRHFVPSDSNLDLRGIHSLYDGHMLRLCLRVVPHCK